MPKRTTHRTPITAPSTPPKAVHAYIPCLRGLTSSLLGSWRAALLLAYVATTSASPGRRGTELGNTSSASSRHLQATADTPNVLLFVADDLGVGDIKASGYMDENGKSTTRVSTAHTYHKPRTKPCSIYICYVVVYGRVQANPVVHPRDLRSEPLSHDARRHSTGKHAKHGQDRR